MCHSLIFSSPNTYLTPIKWQTTGWAWGSQPGTKSVGDRISAFGEPPLVGGADKSKTIKMEPSNSYVREAENRGSTWEMHQLPAWKRAGLPDLEAEP